MYIEGARCGRDLGGGIAHEVVRAVDGAALSPGGSWGYIYIYIYIERERDR